MTDGDHVIVVWERWRRLSAVLMSAPTLGPHLCGWLIVASAALATAVRARL